MLLLLLALSACGGSSLADRDPEGAKACSALATGLKSKNAKVSVGELLVAGDHASLAETEAIEAAQEPLLGQYLADPEKLRQACVDEGVEMPPLAKR